MEGKSMRLKLLAGELKNEGLEEKIIEDMVTESDYRSDYEILDSLGYNSKDYAVAIRNYAYNHNRIYDMYMEVCLYDKKKHTMNYLKSEKTCIKYYFNDNGFYDDRNGWGEQITINYDIDYVCENHICRYGIYYINNIRESKGILRFDITDDEREEKYATYSVHLAFGAIKKETYDKKMEEFIQKRA